MWYYTFSSWNWSVQDKPSCINNSVMRQMGATSRLMLIRAPIFIRFLDAFSVQLQDRSLNQWHSSTNRLCVSQWLKEFVVYVHEYLHTTQHENIDRALRSLVCTKSEHSVPPMVLTEITTTTGYLELLEMDPTAVQREFAAVKRTWGSQTVVGSMTKKAQLCQRGLLRSHSHTTDSKLDPL